MKKLTSIKNEKSMQLTINDIDTEYISVKKWKVYILPISRQIKFNKLMHLLLKRKWILKVCDFL